MAMLFDDKAIVRTVELGIEQFRIRRQIDWPFSEPAQIRAQLLHEGGWIIDAMVRAAQQHECLATYPRDWWQAVKERWAPAWALKRWPVQKMRIDMAVIYPKIALPRERHFVTVHAVEM